MTHRGQQVWHLLRAYVAYAHGLRTGTGQIVSRGSTPGETPSKKIPCPRCEGTGRKRIRGVSKPCDECLETNEKSRLFGKPTGRVTIDSYTGRRLAGEQPTHRMTPQEMSAWEHQTELTLSHIESLLKMNEGEEAEHDSFSAAYETGKRLLAQGSFTELAQALTWLREANGQAHSLIWQALIYASFGPPVGTVRTVCEGVCDVLAHKMPERIIVPAWAREAASWSDSRESLHRGRTLAHAKQRDARDAEIQSLPSTPAAVIAAQYGISERHARRLRNSTVASSV